MMQQDIRQSIHDLGIDDIDSGGGGGGGVKVSSPLTKTDSSNGNVNTPQTPITSHLNTNTSTTPDGDSVFNNFDYKSTPLKTPIDMKKQSSGTTGRGTGSGTGSGKTTTTTTTTTYINTGGKATVPPPTTRSTDSINNTNEPSYFNYESDLLSHRNLDSIGAGGVSNHPMMDWSFVAEGALIQATSGGTTTTTAGNNNNNNNNDNMTNSTKVPESPE